MSEDQDLCECCAPRCERCGVSEAEAELTEVEVDGPFFDHDVVDRVWTERLCEDCDPTPKRSACLWAGHTPSSW